MGTTGFKRYFCLLLAAIMLAASSHHSLCDAGVVHCAPCQSEGVGGEDSCPECTVSHSIARTSVSSVKWVLPAASVSVLTEDLWALFFASPEVAEPSLAPLDFISPQKDHYLRDLVQSIPIRGPTLKV